MSVSCKGDELLGNFNLTLFIFYIIFIVFYFQRMAIHLFNLLDAFQVIREERLRPQATRKVVKKYSKCIHQNLRAIRFFLYI